MGGHPGLGRDCVAHVFLVCWKVCVLCLDWLEWLIAAVDWNIHKLWPIDSVDCRLAALSCRFDFARGLSQSDLPLKGLYFCVWYLLLLYVSIWLDSWERSRSAFDFCVCKLASIRVHSLFYWRGSLFCGVAIVGRYIESRYTARLKRRWFKLPLVFWVCDEVVRWVHLLYVLCDSVDLLVESRIMLDEGLSFCRNGIARRLLAFKGRINEWHQIK